VARRIATARPLAACDTARPDSSLARHWWSRWLAPREGYLAVEWLEVAENLHLWAWQLADRAAADRFRRAAQCAESLGRLLGRMHSRHVSHRDLKGSNLLVADSPDGPRTWLIDTDGVRIRAHLSARRRAADLARLATSVEAHPWVSRTVRWRFLQAYAAQFPRGSVDPRSLWKAVARRSQRQIARKRRQGKPIL
jgi:tRNA A-37 threonylcarbamoyl transferase component Bud32